MILQKNDKDGVRVITLCNRLDIHNVFEIEEQMTNMVDSEHTKIVVDFKKVEYFGSNGIRILMLVKRKLDGFNGKLVLTRLTPFVLKILRAIDLMDLFTITDNLEEAIAMLNDA